MYCRLTTTGYDLNTSRGSSHVHGVAWLQNAPDVQNVLASDDPLAQDLIRYIDRTVSTTNPAVLHDGSNISNASPALINSHICSKPYSEVEDHLQDLNDLIATPSDTHVVQLHIVYTQYRSVALIIPSHCKQRQTL